MKLTAMARWLAFAAAVLALLVAGCGGGVGSGGTGISPGLAEGTVNGFGSVIVDGERFDDSQVAVFEEDGPGNQTRTEALLGERVEFELDAAGLLTRLRVDAALVGPVDRVDAAAGFTVLGQAVTINTDATQGPVTQFGGGYTGLASMLAADAVEVHGFIVHGAAGAAIQATRVERRTALPAFLKLSGVASAVDPTGFRLGALRVLTGTATVLPAGASLADGQAVAVLAPLASLVGSAGAPTQVDAAQVRIRVAGSTGEEVRLSGVISALDAAAARFDLGTTHVEAAGAQVLPAGTALADGLYVQVRGTVRADGSVNAVSVRVRDGRSEAEAELKGNVEGLDLATLHFSVRGVAVDASRAEIESCPNGALADGQFVEVEGALGATGVIAKSVHCEDEPDGATVERKGTAGSVDAAASRFTLSTGSGEVLAVRWTELTYFKNVTPATLAGQRVEVEGRLVDGVLVAQKVKVEIEGN
ncbi:MAG: DUF5666 domain-containing protein [Piscinibacter sp.]